MAEQTITESAPNKTNSRFEDEIILLKRGTFRDVGCKVSFVFCHKFSIIYWYMVITYGPRHEKTGFLHMRKQRRRSAAQ